MPLRVALLLTPPSDYHLSLAAQVGAEEIVLMYPGLNAKSLQETYQHVASYGLKITVIERLIPHDKIVHNLPGRDEQIQDFITLMENCAQVGIKTLCYNWMPDNDWTRTSVDVKERGNALVTSFDANVEEKAVQLDANIRTTHITSSEELWDNLKYFLDRVIPRAEELGVVLALHPDDPPMAIFRGKPQIIYNVEQLEKVMKLKPSPSNGICFCQGTLASAGINIPNAIRQLAPFIKFIHFRDVVGELPNFRESFQDNGKTNMAECIRLYEKEFNLDVPIRPDHVPTLEGETNESPGYHMLGRLWAVGYIRGLLDAVRR